MSPEPVYYAKLTNGQRVPVPASQADAAEQDPLFLSWENREAPMPSMADMLRKRSQGTHTMPDGSEMAGEMMGEEESSESPMEEESETPMHEEAEGEEPLGRRMFTYHPDGGVSYFAAKEGQLTGGERKRGASIADLLRQGYKSASGDEYSKARMESVPMGTAQNALRRIIDGTEDGAAPAEDNGDLISALMRALSGGGSAQANPVSMGRMLRGGR